MGYKSAKKSNVSEDKYEINNLVFPSRHVFTTIQSIDRNLRFLYSPAPSGSIWPTIKYSPTRDDDDEFDAILDRVEERINRIKEEVKIIEKDDAAFNQQFLGIIDFLYEAEDILEKREEYFQNNGKYLESSGNREHYFENMFIYLSKRLWDLGIGPSDF